MSAPKPFHFDLISMNSIKTESSANKDVNAKPEEEKKVPKFTFSGFSST